jgi:hypothetical protein
LFHKQATGPSEAAVEKSQEEKEMKILAGMGFR